MTFKKTLLLLVTGALVAGGIFGGLLFKSALAQDDNTGATTPTTTTPSDQNTVPAQPGVSRGDGFRGDKGFRGMDSSDDQYLADALGISTDELSAARQKAYQAAVDQALENGLITQAQADQLKSGDGAFPFGDRWGGWLKDTDIDQEALLAEALGITVEKLDEAQTTAYNARLEQAVTDGNLTQEQADLMKGKRALYASVAYQTSMQSAFEAAVAQAVADGTITQAQADLILADAPIFGGMHGMDGFGGGHRGGPHSDRDFNPPAVQP